MSDVLLGFFRESNETPGTASLTGFIRVCRAFGGVGVGGEESSRVSRCSSSVLVDDKTKIKHKKGGNEKAQRSNVEYKYQKIGTIDPRSSRSEACASEIMFMDFARFLVWGIRGSKTATNALPDFYCRYE
jgi:hypothetical protein